MAKAINPENGDENEKDFESQNDYEIIDESEIESVKRGRKPNIDEKLLEMMKNLAPKKGIVLNLFSVKEIGNETDRKKAKAKHSATIRTHAKKAGWTSVSVAWQENGIPVAKRNG